MAGDCVPRPVPECGERPAPQPDTSCHATWEMCLPWGGRIWSEDGCVQVSPGSPPPDGVYGKIIIANGCIVGAEPAEVPLYTGSPCAPLPYGCGDSGGSGSGGGSGICDASPVAGNLFTCDAAGRPLVRIGIRAGSGASVSGSGTDSDPYVISCTGGGNSGIYITSANDAISVMGQGTRENPVILKHKEGKQANINGMVFDAYGHLIDTNSGSVNKGIQGLIPGPGITIDTDAATGNATVGLQKPPGLAAGAYSVGGYNLDIDENGRIFAVTREIDLGDWRVEHWGTKTVTVNPYGSIVDITETNDPGIVYYLGWAYPTSGGITRRGGNFSMRHASGIFGLFFTAGDEEFWQSLTFKLDDVLCGTGNSSNLIGAAVAAMSGADIPMPMADGDGLLTTVRTFWGGGVYGPGVHTFEASAGKPWMKAGALAVLFAANVSNDTWEA